MLAVALRDRARSRQRVTLQLARSVVVALSEMPPATWAVLEGSPGGQIRRVPTGQILARRFPLPLQ